MLCISLRVRHHAELVFVGMLGMTSFFVFGMMPIGTTLFPLYYRYFLIL